MAIVKEAKVQSPSENPYAVVKFKTNEKLYTSCKCGEYFDWWYQRDGMQ